MRQDACISFQNSVDKFEVVYKTCSILVWGAGFIHFSAGLNLQSWDIFSLRQPDAIKYIELMGEGYLVTANEGEGLEYEAGSKDWAEFERGEYFFESEYLYCSFLPWRLIVRNLFIYLFIYTIRP